MMASVTNCSISALLEMKEPRAPITNGKLLLPAVLQGITYQPLKGLLAGDISADIIYYNDRDDFHCERLSSIICQGVLCINDCDDGPPDLYIRASEMGLCGGQSKDLPALLHHGHIGFVGSVRERLQDNAEHHIYLVQQRSWLGNAVAGTGPLVNCQICCAIPPWKAKTLDQLRLKATLQFIGNIIGCYPDSAGKCHICMVVTDVSFITPSVGQDPQPVAANTTSPCDSVLESPRKRRLAQLSNAAVVPITIPSPVTPDTTPVPPSKKFGKQEDLGEIIEHPRRGRR